MYWISWEIRKVETVPISRAKPHEVNFVNLLKKKSKELKNLQVNAR